MSVDKGASSMVIGFMYVPGQGREDRYAAARGRTRIVSARPGSGGGVPVGIGYLGCRQFEMVNVHLSGEDRGGGGG